MWHTPHTALLSSQHERDEQAFIENKYQELSARIDNTASHLIVAGDWNAHSSNKPPPDITFMWRSQSVAQHSDQQIFATKAEVQLLQKKIDVHPGNLRKLQRSSCSSQSCRGNKHKQNRAARNSPRSPPHSQPPTSDHRHRQPLLNPFNSSEVSYRTA